jgi:alginate production protein
LARSGGRSALLLPALGALLLLHGGGPAAAAEDAAPGSTDAAESAIPKPDAEQAENEEDELRERLTEREDKRRPLQPFSISVAGRPLTIGGEYEIELGSLRPRLFGKAKQRNRLLLEQGLQLETFYSFGPELSLFAQVRAAVDEDLLPHTFEAVHDAYLEREEMWLYSQNIRGSHLNFGVGRLDFEDDRRWWWDAELDALSVAYERKTFEITLAVARELFSDRTDQSFVDPEQEGVLRVIGEAGWDWRPGHALELFLLYQDDRSPPERSGQVTPLERADETDARLTWVGARAIGVLDLHERGFLGYWLDTALVRGEERFAELEDLPNDRAAVEAVGQHDVSGWAFDAGLNWILAVDHEPRLFAGYAIGSGDREREAGTDHSFRQTGIEDNEAGFGGVERFPSYGVLLDPELSNLGVLTVGVGLSLLRSSSLDLVYHSYWQIEPSVLLPDSRLEAELTGRDRDLGQEVDLVLALEEWERFELTFAVSGFRAGRAFGPEHGTWSWGAFAAMRIAF